MTTELFEKHFQAEARMFMLALIRIALAEDGPDLTAQGLFNEDNTAQAQIIAKQSTIVAGLPLIPLVLEFGGAECQVHLNVDEGDRVSEDTMVAAIQGPAIHLLKTERVIMNFLCRLSGIAEMTSQYVAELAGTETTLLDTRKTTPGLRYLEKYAVMVGGGKNHRKNLTEMLMLKDNHIDRVGSITQAVSSLHSAYEQCPPIEVECRSLEEVKEASACNIQRIMLDNMSPEGITEALKLVPESIETEVSGNISLDNIKSIAQLGPDFISVGKLTHSAPASDFSMQFLTLGA